ncbi:MAG: hypothetical protein HRU19_01580 [Pseudobacteriovorax sp.]|nr:hypothetical protein [Pseudobacteriovorax sp.]
MKSIPLKSLFASVLCSGLVASHAMADCAQTKINITDATTGEVAELVTFCDGTAIEVPDSQNLAFVKWSNGVLCTAIKNCSNIRSWKGTFSASTDLELTGKVKISDLEYVEFEGEAAYNVFDFEWETSIGDESVYCKPIEKECIAF